MKPRFVFPLFVLALLPGAIAAQEKAAWTPMQSMQVKRIGGVQVSPDAKRVVYAVRQALLDDGQSEYVWHIWIASADGTGAVQLAKGDDPQWSPDGQWIAFVANNDAKRNLWRIASAGGEPKRVSNVKTAVTSYKWSPDSSKIAFTAAAGPSREKEKAIREKNDARVVDEKPRSSRLFVVSMADGATTVVSGDLCVPGTGRAGFDWSHDGKHIVFTSTATAEANDWPTADLFIADAAGKGYISNLANSKASEYSPLYSPKGKEIAYVASDNPPTWAGTGQIYEVPEGGKPRRLADTFDGWGRYSEIIGWAADGKSLYFTEVHGTVTRVGRLPLDGPPEILGKFDGFALGGVHLNAARTHFGFSWETLDKPAEAHISPVDRFEPKPVSQVNAKLPTPPLGKTEVLRWKSKDGLDIEGLLTYPTRYEKGERYPLLLNVHGGPAGVFTQSFVAAPGSYPIAAFSARGYAVLRPNPRGSSGYGKKFRYANYGDWGGGDYHDLMTGVDHVIKLGVADEQRLGIMGWSYGGFMTSWTITQTQRFKAASVGAGVTNLMSFTGTADIPSFLPDYFAGEPWDNFDAYRKRSAMFHIKGVKTPTLIQHGERDERVPLSQGQELYNALKRQGCVTKMVIYPRTPHGIQEPRLLVDCMERNLDWFDRYVAK